MLSPDTQSELNSRAVLLLEFMSPQILIHNNSINNKSFSLLQPILLVCLKMEGQIDTGN